MADPDEVDFSIPPKDRLSLYVKSKSEAQQLHCTECVVDCVASATKEELLGNLIPAIQELIEADNSDIGDAMIMMLPDFVDQVISFFPNYAQTLIIDNILPILHTCFELGTEQVAESYVTILRNLPTEYFVEHEIPELRNVCHNPDHCIRLLVPFVIGYLAQTMDPSTWWPGLLELLTQLSRDASDEVRSKLGPLIAIYSKLITNPKDRAQLQGKFSLLCRDRSADVRKSVAESIVPLSQAMDSISRLVTIIPAAKLLLNDQDEGVRLTILSNIGTLIHSIGASCDVAIVSKFVYTLSAGDPNLAFSAAFAFPSVALTLGQRRFRELEVGFEAASNSTEPRIRRTLAFGLWEWAQLFTNEGVLCETLHTFLRDVPNVSIGVMSHLSDILKFIKNKLDFLCYLQNPRKHQEWRLRLEISKQLRNCIEIFDRSALLESAKMLLADLVWKVRRDAAESMALLVTRNDIKELLKMASKGTVIEKMSLSWIFSLMKSELVSKSVVHRLKVLLDDSIPNVRLSAAKAVLAHQDRVAELRALIPKIQKDSDPDVRQ